jgi:hypothetical protein
MTTDTPPSPAPVAQILANDPRTPADVPLLDTTKVPVEWLELDHNNPRLVDGDQKISDEAVIAQLYRKEELGELLQSISSNGYLDIEPLVVILNQDSKRLTILEGNRRFAAIRLFREPDLVAKIAKTQRLPIALPSMADAFKPTLDKISVYRVADRQAARAFIGFKHINGPAKWDSYAKARFAAEWYRAGGVSLVEISEKIGDKHDTIKRMVTAIYVLEQAERAGLFSIEDRQAGRFNFSHLYTALSRTQYMDYLGLSTAWARFDPAENPISADKLPQLKEVLTWIYGSKQDGVMPIVQTQNPDIKRLGAALTNTEGLHVLKAGGSLDDAFDSTQTADTKFSNALVRARASLREASASSRGYDGKDESLLGIAEDVHETAETIFERMKKKVKAEKGRGCQLDTGVSLTRL